MTEVRIEGAWKLYGTVEAVKDLNLVCPDGEMLALLGPSGCGKTSTLKMLAGIEELSRGEIWFDDRPIGHMAPGARNIAMVFEDYALYPHLTAFENVAFPLRIRHFHRTEIERRVGDVLELLGLTDMRDAKAQNLSGGAQQRISIGRALVRDPELILFDEPLSHLDGDQKVQLRSEIKRLQKTTGLSAVLVTHDQTEAIAMSDRVAVMDRGVLQQVGPPDELYARPANLFVAKFIGEPPMNLLPGDLTEQDGALLLVGEAGWKVRLTEELAARAKNAARSSRMILGVRPEHLALATHDGNPGTVDRCAARIWWRERRGDVEILFLNMMDGNGATTASQAVEDREIIVEIPSPSPFPEGHVVDVCFLPDHVNLFDAETGRNLVLIE